MGLAARSDAVRRNPVRDPAPSSRKTKGATGVPVERLPELIAKVRADEELQRLDLADGVEFLIGTGCRIAQYLGHENPSITQDVYTAKSTGGKLAAKAVGSLLGEPAKRRGSNPRNPLWP